MAKASKKSDPLSLKVVYRATSELTPHPNNPRTHSAKQIQQIASSIERFGFTNPLLIDEQDNVIAGHGRLAAAKNLTIESVPTLRLANLSEDEIRAYRIADNQLVLNGDWDPEILAIEFGHLTDVGFDLSLTGFQLPEIDLLLSQAAEESTQEPENVPEPDRSHPSITQTGDLWKLGKHRLLCADALDFESMPALMRNGLARMAFTDPPYNVRINLNVCGNGKHKHPEFVMASGEMSEPEFHAFLALALRQLVNHSHEGALHYICMDWRHIKTLLSAAEEVYSDHKNLCVWNKDNGGMGSLYRSKHELISVFKYGNAPHINNVELGKHGRYRTNVWDYPGVNSFSTQDRDATLAMHPTVKPVAMIADAILDCTKPNDIVLDIFGGSGSTLLAAHQTKRRARLIEIDPYYCDATIERFQKETGKRAIHKPSGQSFDELRDARNETQELSDEQR